MTKSGVRVGRPSLEDAAQIEVRIIAAAWDVLLERGLENFAIDPVAALAQASKRTIYARFPTRAALYRRMIAVRTAAVIDSVHAGAQAGALADRLAAHAIAFLAFVRSPEGQALAHLQERSFGCGGGEDAPMRRSIHERAIAAVSDTLRLGGGPDADLPADAIPEAATFWVATLIGFGKMIVADPALIPDDRAWARRHAALFLRAVG